MGRGTAHALRLAGKPAAQDKPAREAGGRAWWRGLAPDYPSVTRLRRAPPPHLALWAKRGGSSLQLGSIRLAATGLLALLGAGCVAAASPSPGAPLSAGERAWAKCLACHAVTPGQDDRDGPTLHGIVGREVAAVPGYRYSPALRRYAERRPRWTREALDAFLADPQVVAPGNTMGFFGMRDPAERAALIAWLASEPRPSD